MKNNALKADLITRELFELATAIPTNEHVLRKAQNRMALGNPPGKKGSLGDAVNWEALLKTTPSYQDLCFITDDQDYYSPLDENSFNSFLLEEWQLIKGAKLVYYRRLSLFFRNHLPEIELASEYEKELLIRELANSGTFSQTHSVIAKLNQYTEFSSAQVNDIVEAAISNNQIYWISHDLDVHEFLCNVIKE